MKNEIFKFNIEDYINSEYAEKYISKMLKNAHKNNNEGTEWMTKILDYFSDIENIIKLIPLIHLEKIGYLPGPIYWIVKNEDYDIITTKVIFDKNDIKKMSVNSLPVDFVIVYYFDIEKWQYEAIWYIDNQKKKIVIFKEQEKKSDSYDIKIKRKNDDTWSLEILKNWKVVFASISKTKEILINNLIMKFNDLTKDIPDFKIVSPTKARKIYSKPINVYTKLLSIYPKEVAKEKMLKTYGIEVN